MFGKIIFWIIGVLVVSNISYMGFEVINSHKPFTDFNKIKYGIYSLCKPKNSVGTVIFSFSPPSDSCECLGHVAAHLADEMNITDKIAKDLSENKLTQRLDLILTTAKGSCAFKKALDL